MEPQNPERPTSPWRRLALGVLLVVATVWTFHGALDNGFVLLDDDVNIHRNSLINPPTRAGIERLWREPYTYMYIPVTYTVLAGIMTVARVEEGEAVELAQDRVDPRPFHVANVVVQALCALLVFVLLLALVRNDVAAAAGALLFAIHPVQVESVAWASGMKDLASGVFALAALAVYLGYARSTTRSKWPLFGLATVLFALSCLAKPSAVVVPLLAFVLDVLLVRRNWKAAALAVAPWLAIAVVIAKLATIQPVEREAMDIQVWERVGVAGDAVAFYLGQVVWPDRFVPFYHRDPVSALEGGRGWLLTLVPVALLVVVLLLRRRSPVPLAAFAVFVLGVTPVLGLVPFAFQAFSTVADRYLYLSMLAPALLLARGLAAVPNVATFGLATIALALLGFRSAGQVEKWSDTETLLGYTIEVNPHSSFAFNNLGEIYARRGEVDKGIAHFEEAVRLQPDSAPSRNNLGSYLGRSGRVDEAEMHLREAVRLAPDYVMARMNLASALMGQGELPEAIVHTREAIALEPETGRCHFMLGLLLEFSGDPSGAVASYREASRLEPRDIDPDVRIAVLYLDSNQVTMAIDTLGAALGRNPKHGEAHAVLGRAYLTAGRAADALPHLQQAQQLRPDIDYVPGLVQQARQALGQ